MKISELKNLCCPICGKEISGVPIERFSLKEFKRFIQPVLDLEGFEIRKKKVKK